MKAKIPAAIGRLLRSFDEATQETTNAAFKRGEVLWHLRYGMHGKVPIYETMGFEAWGPCLRDLAERAGNNPKILERELKVYFTFGKVFALPTAKTIGHSKLREISSRWDSSITFVGGEGYCTNPKVVRIVKAWLDFCKKRNCVDVLAADSTIPYGSLQDPASVCLATKKPSKPTNTLFSAPHTLTGSEGASMRLAVQEARIALRLPDLSEAEALAAFVAGMLTLTSKNKKLAAQAHEAMRAAQPTLKAA